MNNKNRRLLGLLTLSALALSIGVTSCKKDKDDNPSDQISAKINGTAYQPSLVEGVYYEEDGDIEITGSRFNSNDTSSLSVGFLDNVTANSVLDFHDASIDYIIKGTHDYASGAYGSHGTVTVTTFDKTNKRVAGTFSGVLYQYNTTDSVVITDGKFNTSYTSE